MTRRVRFGLLASGLFAFMTILYLSFGSSQPTLTSYESSSLASSSSSSAPFGGSIDSLGLSEGVLGGGAIAPKLGNETLKKELGRASWRLMHTMMARFPEKPTPDDSLALQTYIKLFARLYPCGECAAHFQTLLEKYPPQTSSRNAAAGWACFVHNEVNTRLKKELFDCNKIGDFYDCGCGDEDGKGGHKAGHKSDSKGDDDLDSSSDDDLLSSFDELAEGTLKIEKEEGLTRGD